MKKAKLLLTLVLIAAMVLAMFAACAKDGGSDRPAGTPDTQEELATIKMVIFDFNSSGVDHKDRIQEAINAISVPAINVQADILFLNMGDFASKVQSSIAGGEQIDLMTASIMNNASTLYQAGMLRDITEELKTYAPGALEVVGDAVKTYTWDGKIYGLPTQRNLLTCRWIIMNKDVLDELSLTEQAQNMKTWTEYEQILTAVKDGKQADGMYPLISNSGAVFQGALFTGDELTSESYDTLGDRAGIVYASQEGKISLLQETESWIYTAKKAAEWNEKGLIYPDSIINTTLSGNDLLNQGVDFSLICSSEYGVENSGNYQMPVVAKQISDPILMTSSLTMWGMAVPVTAEEPEAACKFLNLMYTSPELMNVMVNGQEGKDYELVNGEVSPLEKGYRGGNFIMGNNLLLTPALGQGADFNETVKAKMAEMKNSRFLGFTIDASDLNLLIANMSAVNDQYRSSMTGGDYTDALYEEYMSKLQAAGAQEYLDAVQTQLDAWLAAN
ncbi:MAG: extracellular solute-binding protein [Oscillospiraceae bacterium]|nr:extracellular solute-binding protein [Oscillospiraceae bacterium]